MTEIRPEQRLTILKHLATGKNLDMVATITHLSKDTVSDVARNHGYPDREKLAWAVDVVAKSIEKDRSAAIPASTAPATRALPTQPGPSSAPQPTAGAASVAKPDEFRILINAAKQCEKKRIQSLADKILEDCAKLRGLLDAETQASKAKRREEAERQAARAEVERLEQQLAEAKAKLKGAAKAPAAARTGSTAPKGDFPCRNHGCEKHYDTPQGRSLHERLRCEHRPEAAAS